MRKCRAEVGVIVKMFRVVEKDKNLTVEEKQKKKLELLNSLGIPKWPGKVADRNDPKSTTYGDPIKFLMKWY
jgi:hypothetical protein